MAELESCKAMAQQAIREAAGNGQDIGQIFRRLLSLEQADKRSKVPSPFHASISLLVSGMWMNAFV